MYRDILQEDEKEYLAELAKKLPVQMTSRSGYYKPNTFTTCKISWPLTAGVRYCPRCRLIKPDRCHHCSLCNRCVLKMDHHCPWYPLCLSSCHCICHYVCCTLCRINNCVGFSNYKFFFLFLFYTMVLCLYIGLSSISDVIRAWVGVRCFYAVSLFCCFLRLIILEVVLTHPGFDLIPCFCSSCVWYLLLEFASCFSFTFTLCSRIKLL